jgi:hypothetical protein
MVGGIDVSDGRAVGGMVVLVAPQAVKNSPTINIIIAPKGLLLFILSSVSNQVIVNQRYIKYDTTK